MTASSLHEKDFYHRNYFSFISRRSVYCKKKWRIYASRYKPIWSKGTLPTIPADTILEKWRSNNLFIFSVEGMLLKTERSLGAAGSLINSSHFRFGNIVVNALNQIIKRELTSLISMHAQKNASVWISPELDWRDDRDGLISGDYRNMYNYTVCIV